MIRRIALVCTGLEEGADGVGDYCRLLAQALSALGIDCVLVALNDRHVDGVIYKETTLDGARGKIPMLRLARECSWPEKFPIASKFMASFAPDWVVFQFVSYGLNKRGLIAGDLFWLWRLFRPYKLDLMFHETWIGQGAVRTPKVLLIGLLQRELTRVLIGLLKPELVHASNALYVSILRSIGLEANVLPLFGNISVVASQNCQRVQQLLLEHGGPDLAINRDNYWLFGMFGAVLSFWPFADFFQTLCRVCKVANREPIIVLFGRIASDPDQVLRPWKHEFPNLKIVYLGEQPAALVSEIMGAMDFAITSYEHYAVGKSGSAAAFFEHGVPVIATWGRDPEFLNVLEAPFDRMLLFADDTLEAELQTQRTRVQYPDHPLQLAKRLLHDLERRAP